MLVMSVVGVLVSLGSHDNIIALSAGALVCVFFFCCFLFFQAECGIRDLVRSRGLGDVYKRQA